MSVFITGDTHGEIEMKKLSHQRWLEGRKLTKKDYVIITGDFGLLWSNQIDSTERYWTTWLNEKPWTTLFVDGNHENHIRLAQLETIEMFGSKVGKISDSIFHLKRGEIYTIEDHKLFTFGGAESIDKESRILDVSWWKEEVPSYKEMNYGLENLKKNNNKVDFIITHTAPRNIVTTLLTELNISMDYMNDPTQKFLQHLYECCQFKAMYCGHFHTNRIIDKCHLLFEKIERLHKI